MLEGIKILAADDDDMSLEMLTSILGSQGALCTAVANGREAMDRLESDPDIDIVLLDLQMPVMDGFEVLAQCKGNPYLCDIPVIVMAANHLEKLKSLKLGADDFLAKPYDLEELELRISRLMQSQQHVQAAKQAKREFLAIASHELRTPMLQITALSGLLDDKELGDEQRELVNQLKLATGGLTAIVSDILNYVQLDHGSSKTLMEPFSLRATVQGALDAGKQAADEKYMQLVLSLDDEVSDALNGPSFYLYKVISILVTNAIRFSSGGSVRIAIREESLGKHSSQFYCSVNDEGESIPASFHDRIFEPFVQLDSSESRRFEGLGLGLAIAKRMVELIGGTIYLKSSSGVGNSFNFSFLCDLQGAADIS